jgi:hypothetical protein
VYAQPPALNIGENPGAGSVRVPVNVLLGVIVPRSSIADPPPLDALSIRSADPSLKLTVPLKGKITVAGGFCQLLVVVFRVPPDNTSRWAVKT